MHCTLHSIFLTALYTAQYIAHCTAHCTVHSSLHCTLHSTFLTALYTAQYIPHCTVHCSVHSSLHCTVHSTFLTAPDYRVHQCSAVWHQQHWSTTPDQQLGHKRLFLVSRIEELTDPLLCASFEAPVVRINFTVSRN